MMLSTYFIRVRAMLSLKGSWTVGWLAADRNSRHVDVFHSDACRFCLMGAMERVAWDSLPDLSDRETVALELATGPKSVMHDFLRRREPQNAMRFAGVAVWNDNQPNVSTVLSALDDLITELKAKGQ